MAIGVTAASLLGWFQPVAGAAPSEPALQAPATPPTPAASPIILVPISPTPPTAAPAPANAGEVQLAMDVGGRERDDEDDEEGEHDDD